MRKIIIFTFVFLAVAISATPSFSFLLKPGARLQAEVGLFASMPAACASLSLPIPKMKDTFARVGAGFADSKMLSPAREWRRFAPVFLNLVHYETDELYFGFGFNLPIKASNAKVPDIGGQFFLGLEKDYDGNKLFIESGYSELRVKQEKPFQGPHIMIGFRYISPLSPVNK
jgi:hypothetical protein